MAKRILLLSLATLLAATVTPGLAFAGGDASFAGGIQVQSQKTYKHGRRAGPATPAVGRPVTFRAVIVVGSQAVDNLLVVGGIDGQQKHAQTYPRLEAGSRKVISFTWTATAGSHGAYFQIDPNGTGADSNAANNRVDRAFTVSDCSTDLMWQGRIRYDGQRLDGNTVTAKATLVSAGGRASNVRVTGGIDKITKLNRTIQKINPGGQQEVSFQYTAKFAGGRPQRVWFKASTAGCDINSQNNTLADRSRPGERMPDLSVATLNLYQLNKTRSYHVKGEGRRFAGQTVQIRVVVANSGTGAAGPFKAVVRIGRQLVGQLVFDRGVGADQTREGSLNYTLKKTGKTKVTVELDRLNEIKESDETNNTTIYDLHVMPKRPELRAGIVNPTEGHTSYRRTSVGKRTDIKVAVRNLGYRQSQPTTMTLKCTGKGKKTKTRVVPALKPGEEKTWRFWFRWGIPSRYECEVRVDDDKKNREYRTDNNHHTMTIAVRVL
ncbi:MAG: hypothetical protein KJO07_23655 [Deltaproteobacteria bacterium]|nr:hypothetical protein [Deltaproteobacteria bacterium]